MKAQSKKLIDSLPYDAITERVRESTHGIFDVCRQKTAGQRLYGFVWGADSDITSVDWRANTEERLLASAEKWLAEVRAKFPDENLTLEMGLHAERFDPHCWKISTDLPVPMNQRDLNPSDAIDEVWQQVKASGFDDDEDDDDDDEVYEVYKEIQKRILEAIIRGISQFDSEYAWQDLDRTQILLSVFIWGGDPKLNLDAAKKLNGAQLFQEFKKRYAPAS